MTLNPDKKKGTITLKTRIITKPKKLETNQSEEDISKPDPIIKKIFKKETEKKTKDNIYRQVELVMIKEYIKKSKLNDFSIKGLIKSEGARDEKTLETIIEKLNKNKILPLSKITSLRELSIQVLERYKRIIKEEYQAKGIEIIQTILKNKDPLIQIIEVCTENQLNRIDEDLVFYTGTSTQDNTIQYLIELGILKEIETKNFKPSKDQDHYRIKKITDDQIYSLLRRIEVKIKD